MMTTPAPIQMLLWCPMCSERHIDEGEFATKPHHTHACQGCGMVWRPAIEPTCGVQFLPGFKNGTPNFGYSIGERVRWLVPGGAVVLGEVRSLTPDGRPWVISVDEHGIGFQTYDVTIAPGNVTRGWGGLP